MSRINRNTVLLAILVVMAVGLLAGCAGKPGDEDRVVARIGHVNITYGELKERLAELPVQMREQFSTPEGMIDFLKKLVEEEVLYQAAEDAGYATSP